MPNELDKPSKKVLTPLQQSFLAHLWDTKGNAREAMRKAGYSDNTALSEVVKPLKEEILELSKDILAYSAVKAASGLIDVLDTPSKLGAANAIKASTEILDRIGVIKQQDQEINIPQGTIFILPPKDNKRMTIDYESIDIIDITPNG